MIALAVVVLNNFVHGSSEVTLADLIDRTKPLSVGIGVRPLERRLDHANPTSLKILVRAARRDQQSMNAKNAIPRGTRPRHVETSVVKKSEPGLLVPSSYSA